MKWLDRLLGRHDAPKFDAQPDLEQLVMRGQELGRQADELRAQRVEIRRQIDALLESGQTAKLGGGAVVGGQTLEAKVK